MNRAGAIRAAALAALLCCSWASFAQDYRIDLSSSIDWERFELKIDTAFDLASAGLRMPTGRSQAETLADQEFPRLARPLIYGIPVDSSTTVETLVAAGSLSPSDVGAAAGAARKSASALTPDFRSLSASYLIDLGSLAASLVRHRAAAETPRTPLPRPTRTYTGIIIYANEKLPLHGTRIDAYAAACFFPKIWDSEMNLIYERNMVDPDAARGGIVRYGSSTDEKRYERRVGKSPLRVLARGLFGMLPTDPVIDRDDALKILSSDENRALLREGRVVVVLSEAAVRGAR